MDLSDVVASLAETAATVFESPTQMFAHGAAAVGIALMTAGAITRTMLPLRWLAVGGNIGLLIFGAVKPSTITMLAALALLPVNLYRAIEVTRLALRVKRAQVGADMASMWLRPHMKLRKLAAGQVLFHKGAVADHLYLLAAGQLELAELGVPIEPGRIFGEIALFSHDRRRTQTVRCLTDCSVLQINATTVRELFFQNPSFAFHLMELLASRLRSDIARAEGEAPTADESNEEPAPPRLS